MKKKKFGKVLILGSGGIKISQAGEFDYSGSQAIKALKEEGIYTILVNPNIATIQTNTETVYKIYFEPLNIKYINKIISIEKPNKIILSFGGQTALNLGLKLDKTGILFKYKIEILGNTIHTIKNTEDRWIFKNKYKNSSKLNSKQY